MTSEELNTLYDKASELRAEGKEVKAQALLSEHLSELPEEMQGQILLDKFADAMEEEATALQAKRDLQQMGLEAAEKLFEQSEQKD